MPQKQDGQNNDTCRHMNNGLGQRCKVRNAIRNGY